MAPKLGDLHQNIFCLPLIFEHFGNFLLQFAFTQQIIFGQNPGMSPMLGAFGISILIEKQGNGQNGDTVDCGFEDGILA